MESASSRRLSSTAVAEVRDIGAGVDIESVIAENDKLIDEANKALLAVAEFASLIRSGVDLSKDSADRQSPIQTLLDDLLAIRARLTTQQAYLKRGRKLNS